MEVLWKRAEAMAVREVCARLDGETLAYTTVMTTLDRLYKKGLLRREKDGTAFVYQPAMRHVSDLSGGIAKKSW